MLAKPDLLILDERIKQLGPAGDYLSAGAVTTD